MSDQESTALAPVTIDLRTLAEFQPDIEELQKYEGMQIAGIEDPEGYDLVKAAISACRKLRGRVEKERKRLKDPVIQVGNAIQEMAREAEKEIRAIERPLKATLDVIDHELAQIAQAAREAKERRLAERVDALRAAGADWSPIAVAEMDDDEYEQNLSMALVAQKQRQEAEERERAAKEADEARKAEELAEAKREAAEAKAEAKRVADAYDKRDRELEELRAKLAKQEQDDLDSLAVKEASTSPDVEASAEPVLASAGSAGGPSLVPPCSPDEATAAANLAQGQVFAMHQLSTALGAAVDAWPQGLESPMVVRGTAILIADAQIQIQGRIESLASEFGTVTP